MEMTVARPQRRSRREVEGLPPYNVVLLNDDDHSFDYVVRMMKELFGHPPVKGFKIAMQVDATGRAVVATTNLERAELGRDQIQSFGPDPLVSRCEGSMSATVEPASG
jgi:ATP-dependent Clp protease adaptor protein ClpS